MDTELDDDLNFLDDDEVEKKQSEEDLRLYGSRPEPPEVIDVDESIHLRDLPPKRNASEFEAAVDRPAKARRVSESKDFNYRAVTAMDWNSGASPLDAWLNQSAMPLASPEPLQEQKPQDQNLAAVEAEEINTFRNVHIAEASRPTSHKASPDVANEIADLDLQIQIYYRNIMDRYPILPNYLARRLAVANHRRAERLKSKRVLSKPFEVHEDADLRPSSQHYQHYPHDSIDGELGLSKDSARMDATENPSPLIKMDYKSMPSHQLSYDHV